ncbi:MAG: RidA family protein [Promethearchaeota archaeon]
MVNIEYFNPGPPAAGPYTPVIKVGNLIFISGQIPEQENDGIREQTKNVLKKIKVLLESSGASISNVVKVNIYLKNIEDFKEMNDGYKEFFMNNGIKEKFPARTTVQAQPPIDGVDLEIDAIAVV